MKRYTRLTLAEREEISRHVAVGVSVRAMAQQLARSLTYDRGEGDSRTPPLHQGDEDPGLLRAPAQPLGARHQREHQRADPAVLPEGD
jgi:hypothetical protein